MTKTSRNLLAITSAVALSLCSLGASAAGSLAGQLNAQMVLQSGCVISGDASGAATGVNFGTLDFGIQPSTFTGVLTTAATAGAGGAGATNIICSPDVTSLNVAVSAGNNAGQGASIGTGARAMKKGTSYLPYDVYSDSGLTTVYPTSGSAVGITLPGTGAAFPLPVYGRINKTSANAMASGTYTDVLQVTLSW
jgi:spore coat protein U-like protein